MAKDLPIPEGYDDFLLELKKRVETARVRAALSINRELVLLYLSIGRDILERQENLRWGAKVLDRLSHDLRRAFPGAKGFSVRNLKYMRTLARELPDGSIGQQLAAQLPWFHSCTLVEKVKDPAQREWYARASIEHGWSRNVLVLQIDSGLYARQGKALTNFEDTLPSPQSDLAGELLKDPYHLDFLPVGQDAHERDLQRALVTHLRDFLLELGTGFAFLGDEYRLDIEGDEFFVDLLFYHLGLSCFVVIELKTTDFKPEYTGKLSFYCSVVDDRLRRPSDERTIGILLCRGKKKTVAKYALSGISQPIGISEMKLPENFEGKLPSLEELEAELERGAPEETEDE